MKLETEKGIFITLTQEQIDSIEAQKSPKLTADNINYKSALELLTKHNIDPDPQGLYNGQLLQLITIIKAINFIDNGNKEFRPKKGDTRYLPYFEQETSGWSLQHVADHRYGSHGLGGLYYHKRESAEMIVKRYMNTLYKTCLG